MKALVVISAVVGLTLVALYVVASLKGLTLEQYLNSIWGRYKAYIKSAREAEAEKMGAESEVSGWRFDGPWVELKPWIEM